MHRQRGFDSARVGIIQYNLEGAEQSKKDKDDRYEIDDDVADVGL